MVELNDCLPALFSWISGPYHSLIIKFAAVFLLIEGLELGVIFLRSYIERKGAAKQWETHDEYLFFGDKH